MQLPWDGNQEIQLVNSTFGLLYDLLRSLRGVVIFIIYVCKRTILSRFQNLIRHVRNVRNADEIARYNDVDLGADNHRISSHSHWERDHFDAAGKINSEDTTSFHNQACNIDDEAQENSKQQAKESTVVIHV